MRSGRKSASQTPAPLKDRIYGSKKNKEGSASSDKSAKSIILSAETLIGLKNKLKEFKEKHPNKDNITLNDLKAVYRRGLGAYSSTHRPTISGGVPNTRNAWAMARVNKFLLKAGGTKVKKAYVQDDDLIKYAEGGNVQKLAFIEKWENGSYWLISKYENDLYYPIDGAYKLYVVKDMAKRWGYKLVSKKEYEKLVSTNQYGNVGELKMYDAEPKHAKIYGFDAEKPLYIENIISVPNEKDIKYILEYASKNGNDVIFGHIAPEQPDDIELIKSMLVKSGFNTIEGNNDYYKIINGKEKKNKK